MPYCSACFVKINGNHVGLLLGQDGTPIEAFACPRHSLRRWSEILKAEPKLAYKLSILHMY